MNLDRVPAGKEIPHDCNVIIEIPMRADPIKYEVDKDTGAVFVDRFMSTAMHYPCNYGYIPHTLSDDGDPCDVLVLSPVPLITGVVVRCRPIGMLKMDDEAGGDHKILAVPIDALSEIALVVEQPDGDERQTKIARGLAVIAGQHAQTARIDRHRFVNAELGREIGDRLGAQDASIGAAARSIRLAGQESLRCM